MRWTQENCGVNALNFFEDENDCKMWFASVIWIIKTPLRMASSNISDLQKLISVYMSLKSIL